MTDTSTPAPAHPDSGAEDMGIGPLIDICEGNPGALVALVHLNSRQHFEAVKHLAKLGIHGSAIHILHSDACGRDADVLEHVREHADAATLVKASRQQGRDACEVLADHVEAARQALARETTA